MAAKKAKKSTVPTTGKKAAVHRDAVERKRYTMRLPVEVEEEVCRKAAQEMAKIHHAREALKSERRDAMAGFKERMNGLDQQMNDLANTVENSTELREVEVVDRLLPTGEIETVRLDTREVIASRPPTAQELQDSLPGMTEDDPTLKPTGKKVKAASEPEEEEETLAGPRSKSAKK